MEKYKVCPTCGTKNLPTMLECIKCETDLTGVPIGDGILETIPAVNDQSLTEQKNNRMVRICECGFRNPPSARKCSACGEDISDIMPTLNTVLETEQSSQHHYIFSSLDGKYAYEFVSNLTIVGRENTMKEYLAIKPYVSRKHLEVLLEVNKLFIKSYKNTNHTYVNNILIKDEEYVEVFNGDVIGLGGKEINGTMQDQAAFFKVRIDPCT